MTMPTAPDHDSPPTALDTDYYAVFADVPEADRLFWKRARTFAEDTLAEVNQAWDQGEYPLHLARRLGELDLLTDGVVGPGLTPMSPLAAGLVNMEISRGDGSMGTVIAVQGGLALRSIALFGSAEQQARWLVPLARGEKLGAFALTEPTHGSDSVALETTAVRDGDGWVINGCKRWIGNGSVGDVTVVWARDEQGHVRGFLVEQDTPGYRGETIRGKASLRAIHQAHITLTDVRVPLDAVLPGTHSFKDASRVLLATRLGVAWAALGHATAVFEAALTYSRTRIQFGKPLASFQLVQERLTRMLATLTTMQLTCRHLAALDQAGTLTPTQAALAKYTNTRGARELAAIARDMLGGNGILLENHVIRHMADVESLHTYEGTESIQALLIGRDLTGISAFA
ncbi:acyl-CoA dehydrogenase family protein [Nakamurella multipartita]|jgi:glutaryl-CoA dehydrogenase|uniref:Acyl-CoA dehydrogenase domain protein n=1 Tax=Nakamurella multipartita (strain ATCC 700099 / DSM 44233 / CIP 104796 / JCM 9543 / NBRC 105858 / Y-104) TaxID=479431 RepID=C8XHX8_NAKMY|nr:acyl-CoA dehydrogenase family protein [Nakamurella multipartita]ACV76469.1 acyl-CoA dehydrogenase domain protein [Nakamurella multipartita DSM 44233]